MISQEENEVKEVYDTNRCSLRTYMYLSLGIYDRAGQFISLDIY